MRTLCADAWWISAPVRPPLGRLTSSGHAPAARTYYPYLGYVGVGGRGWPAGRSTVFNIAPGSSIPEPCREGAKHADAMLSHFAALGCRPYHPPSCCILHPRDPARGSPVEAARRSGRWRPSTARACSTCKALTTHVSSVARLPSCAPTCLQTCQRPRLNFRSPSSSRNCAPTAPAPAMSHSHLGHWCDATAPRRAAAARPREAPADYKEERHHHHHHATRDRGRLAAIALPVKDATRVEVRGMSGWHSIETRGDAPLQC